MGAKFGDAKNPLLVSCRSGARVSHARHDGHRAQHRPQRGDAARPDRARPATSASPGTATAASCRCTATSCSASSRRPRPRSTRSSTSWTSSSTSKRRQARHRADRRRPARNWSSASRRRSRSGPARTSPTIRCEQMWGAIGAVFGSWMNDRAIVYRRQYGIPHEWGTAANICAMVFGNMGDDCGTGVAFTRDPATGEKVFYGEYLINAQGEDVVAGIRTPKKIAELQKDMPDGLQAARRDPQEAGEALPRRAGHRVHDPEGQALDAADAQRQADRLRRRALRRRHGRRRADHQGRGPVSAAGFRRTT